MGICGGTVRLVPPCWLEALAEIRRGSTPAHQCVLLYPQARHRCSSWLFLSSDTRWCSSASTSRACPVAWARSTTSLPLERRERGAKERGDTARRLEGGAWVVRVGLLTVCRCAKVGGLSVDVSIIKATGRPLGDDTSATRKQREIERRSAPQADMAMSIYAHLKTSLLFHSGVRKMQLRSFLSPFFLSWF